MTEQEKRAQFFAKTGRIATSELVEYQAFLWGMEYAEESLRQQLAVANHAHEFMSQQYLDALKERNQLRKDVAKLQEALHCKLTWKPS